MVEGVGGWVKKDKGLRSTHQPLHHGHRAGQYSTGKAVSDAVITVVSGGTALLGVIPPQVAIDIWSLSRTPPKAQTGERMERQGCEEEDSRARRVQRKQGHTK